MEFNILPILLAALLSVLIGFVWFSPQVFGNTLKRESGVSAENVRKTNIAVLIIMSLIYAFFIAMMLQPIVIHQAGAVSATQDITGVDASVLQNYLNAYGGSYRTFKHGALHGFIAGLFFALPVIGVPALHEKRSWKYVLITGGYWIFTCTIMGSIICGWR